MEDKVITWVGNSRDEIRDFPEEARRKAGLQLRAIQRGEEPIDFKPMSTVGNNTPDRFVTTKNRIWTESGSSYKVSVSSKPKQTALMNDIIHTLLAKVGFLANLSISF
jgi:hypothetical protein